MADFLNGLSEITFLGESIIHGKAPKTSPKVPKPSPKSGKVSAHSTNRGAAPSSKVKSSSKKSAPESTKSAPAKCSAPSTQVKSSCSAPQSSKSAKSSKSAGGWKEVKYKRAHAKYAKSAKSTKSTAPGKSAKSTAPAQSKCPGYYDVLASPAWLRQCSPAPRSTPAPAPSKSAKSAPSKSAARQAQYSVQFKDELRRVKSTKQVGHLSLQDIFLLDKYLRMKSAAHAQDKSKSSKSKSSSSAPVPAASSAPEPTTSSDHAKSAAESSVSVQTAGVRAEFGGTSWPLKQKPHEKSFKLKNIRGGWDKFIGLRGGMETTEQLCNDCTTTWHKCSACHKKRCKQFHLEAREVGDDIIMICKECDPSVVGLERIRQPTGVMPDQHVDHPDVLRRLRAGGSAGPTAGPSGSQGDHPDSSVSVSPPTKRLKTPSKKSGVLGKQFEPVTPTTPLMTPSRPSVIQLTPRARTPCTPDVQDTPIVPDIPETPVFDIPDDTFEAFPGRLPDCLYVGNVGQNVWDSQVLRNFYFLVLGRPEIVALTLRASKDVELGALWPEILDYFGRKFVLVNPRIWYQGQVLSMSSTLYTKPENSLFLITERGEALPENLRGHRGQIWQCSKCDKSWTYFYAAPKKCEHDLLIEPGQLKKPFGGKLDRKNQKPWGCPVGHYGSHEDPPVVTTPSKSVPRSVPSLLPSKRPVVQSAAPVPSRAPSRVAGVRRNLNVSDAPQDDFDRVEAIVRRNELSQPANVSRTRRAKSAANAANAAVASREAVSSGEEDISSDSGSDKEYQEEEDNESQEESEIDDENNEQEEVTSQPRLSVPDTDDDDDDPEDVRVTRRENKNRQLQEISDRLTGPQTVREYVYVEDAEDTEYFKKYIISPCLQNSGLFKKYGTLACEETVRMIMAGELPTAKTNVQKAIFTHTALDYKTALKAFLGIYQGDLITKGMRHKLVDGQLKIRQFFRFKQDDFLELPENIVSMLDRLVTSNKKMHAMSGYIQLLDSLLEYASTEEGKALFFRRVDDEVELSTAAMNRRADDQRMLMKRHIQELIDNLKARRKQAQYTGQKHLEAEEHREFREEYEGLKLDNPVAAIKAWLSDDSTRAILRELEVLSMNKTVVGSNKMSSLTRDFATIIIGKRGIRKECLGDCFTRGDYWIAEKNKNGASFPYVAAAAHQGRQDGEATRVINAEVEGDVQFVARDNPHVGDPNDPNDPRLQDDTRGLPLR